MSNSDANKDSNILVQSYYRLLSKIEDYCLNYYISKSSTVSTAFCSSNLFFENELF